MGMSRDKGGTRNPLARSSLKSLHSMMIVTSSLLSIPDLHRGEILAPFNVIERRRTAIHLADHAEACEVRMLLSGIAIYPAQAATTDAATTDAKASQAAPVAPAAKVSPLDLSPSDYNGTWDDGAGALLNLSVKGSDPLTAKVTGTISFSNIVGGSTKFKGKVFKGVDLIGKFRAKGTQGPFTIKFKAELMVQLTDSTHFEGEITGVINGIPQPTYSITGTKV